MQRQDKRRVLGDHQRLGRDLHALSANALDLLHEMPGVEHHAIADDAELAAAHDARGQRVQLVDRLADDKRVARIVTALKARDHIGAFGQPVHDLALALVAPLGAHDNHVRHLDLSSGFSNDAVIATGARQ